MNFAQMIKSSQNIVVFSGAGLSTASGVPDFKHAKGFFDKKGDLHFGSDILSIDTLDNNPKLFFDYLNERLTIDNAEPNFGHLFFKRLESEFNKDVAIITQNIDNLHNIVGHKQPVVELHGNISKWKKVVTREHVEASNLVYKEGIAYDTVSNKPIRPDIVLYGEQLNYRVFKRAENLMFNADLLIIVGTELNVYPAADVVKRFRGKYIVYINNTDISESHLFSLFFKEDIVSTLKKVSKLLD